MARREKRERYAGPLTVLDNDDRRSRQELKNPRRFIDCLRPDSCPGGSLVSHAVANQRLELLDVALDRKENRAFFDASAGSGYGGNDLAAIGKPVANGEGAVRAEFDGFALKRDAGRRLRRSVNEQL